MKSILRLATIHLVSLLSVTLAATAADDTQPPTDWVDPSTGHRIIRLSTEPGTGSLYFNLNAYTSNGTKMIITTPGGISTVDLKTHAIEQVVAGKAGIIAVASKSSDVYYSKDGAIFATNVDTKVTREVVKLGFRGSVSTLNADETLLAGVRAQTKSDDAVKAKADAKTSGTAVTASPTPVQIGQDGKPLTFAEAKEVMLNKRLDKRIPLELFTVDIRTGKVKVIHRSTDWLNHLQFSPTDPSLLMFCHEGPWHRVDRIWTIHTDGTKLTQIHKRTMNMEIAGHEFFSGDGKTIWYDLQTPRGQDFWLAGYNVVTHKRTWYHMDRNDWSVHFNVSADGSLFAGDGGDSEMVAHAPDGKWIYLFRPESVPDVAGIKADNAKDLINPGFFNAERLVNMEKHRYTLEPNVRFTPDMKWIVFRSNMFGPTQVFAVELKKADPVN